MTQTVFPYIAISDSPEVQARAVAIAEDGAVTVGNLTSFLSCKDFDEVAAELSQGERRLPVALLLIDECQMLNVAGDIASLIAVID